jgi:hypothetical protein
MGLILAPNPNTGQLKPPRLNVKARFRNSSTNTTGSIRLYTFSTFQDMARWTSKSPASASYLSLTTTSSVYPTAGDMWVASGTIEASNFAITKIVQPDPLVSSGSVTTDLMTTLFVLAYSSSNPASRVRVSAIQVMEEDITGSEF